MTTCAIPGCREEGKLLLHIRLKRENLLQAEYCPEHFVLLMNQWAEDIKLADYCDGRYFYKGPWEHGRKPKNLLEALEYTWKFKSANPEYSTIEELMLEFDQRQSEIKEKIDQRQKGMIVTE